MTRKIEDIINKFLFDFLASSVPPLFQKTNGIITAIIGEKRKLTIEIVNLILSGIFGLN